MMLLLPDRADIKVCGDSPGSSKRSIERWLVYRFADWSKMVAAGDTDYLVDALALHDHLYTLGDMFADPKVIKVALKTKAAD